MAAAPNNSSCWQASRKWVLFSKAKKKKNKTKQTKQNIQKQRLQQHLPPHGWLVVAVRVGHDQLSCQLPHALSLFFTFFVFGLSFLLQLNCLRRIHIHYGEAQS
jgi:hypothetical protein